MSRRASSRTAGIKETTPVANDETKPPSPFDVKTVEALVVLMAEHNLSEIDLRDGHQRLRLCRGGRAEALAPPAAPASAALPAPPPTAATPTVEQAAAAPVKKLLEIKSETVGTFYAAPNPESPPFVHVGSRVTPETVVCIIDVMKNMYEIQAGCSGVVAEILAQNQQPVEYNQVLFRVDPVA
jgi:acetyl-CoA carboxylase biotin carboxyl carrier protein